MNIRTKDIRRLGLIAGLCVTLLLAGCNDRESSQKSIGVTPNLTQHMSAEPPSSIAGDFKVYYSLQASETEGLSTGNKPQKVSAIHFYQDYIVLENEKHGGRIVPIRQIKTFRWD